MERSRKMVVLSHCILNANAKVEGLSLYPATMDKLISFLMEHQIGMLQLPCPEMQVYGIKRWGHVKEQFDTPHFRENSRQILRPLVDQIKNYMDHGYEICGLIGIEGSPSCGISKTCSGQWGGSMGSNPELNEMFDTLTLASEAGVFMEELDRMLKERNIELKKYGIDEENLEISINAVQEALLRSL